MWIRTRDVQSNGWAVSPQQQQPSFNASHPLVLPHHQQSPLNSNSLCHSHRSSLQPSCAAATISHLLSIATAYATAVVQCLPPSYAAATISRLSSTVTATILQFSSVSLSTANYLATIYEVTRWCFFQTSTIGPIAQEVTQTTRYISSIFRSDTKVEKVVAVKVRVAVAACVQHRVFLSHRSAPHQSLLLLALRISWQ